MIGRVGMSVAVGMFLAASLSGGKAEAQVFGNGGGYGLGFYNYSSYDMPRIPYYALYPPVYYSYPVARPYGYSPFAYPPGVLTPEAKPKAVVFHNPYVPKKSAEPVVDRTASNSRVYYNPYVPQTASAGKTVLSQSN